MTRSPWLALSLTLTAGCAASAPTKPPTTPDTAQAAALAVEPALPPAEALPVLLSAGNLERDVFAVADRMEPGNPGIGLLRLGWRTLLASQIGEALAMAVDPSAPVVVAIGSGPAEDAAMVAAIGLLPDRRASLEQAYELRHLGRNIHAMRPRLGSPAENPVGRDVACALLRSGTRDAMACAENGDWLLRHGQYVADQIDTAPRDAALRLDVRGKMLQSPEQVLSAELKSEAARAGYLTTLELLAAMRDFEASLTLVDGGYELGTEFSLRPVADSLAAALVAPAPHDQLLPPPFKALPADATIAFTSRGVAPEHMGKIAGRFWTMMLAGLSENQPDPRWAELIGLARGIFMRGGGLVGAYGHDTRAALTTLTAERAKRRPSERAMRAALADYFLVGLEEEPAQLRAFFEGLLALDARAQAERTDAGQPIAARLVQEKTKRRDKLPGDAMVVRFERLDTAATPPAKRRKAKQPSVLSTRYIVSAAKDGWVWIVTSRDRSLALDRLRGVLSGVQSAPSERLLLLRRPGVRDAVAFGFATPAAVVSMALASDPEGVQLDEAHAALQTLADRPDGGMTPATFSYRHDPSEKDYRRAKLSAFIPDAVLEGLPKPTEALGAPAP